MSLEQLNCYLLYSKLNKTGFQHVSRACGTERGFFIGVNQGSKNLKLGQPTKKNKNIMGTKIIDCKK